MKAALVPFTWLFLITLLLIAAVSADLASAEGGMDAPAQNAVSCQLDLNNEQEDDMALLVHTIAGWDLLVLLKTKDGYDTLLGSRGNPKMSPYCHFGSTIRETSAGRGKGNGRTYHTNGTYLLLAQPEGARVAYFWNASSFQEVWTAD